MTVIEIIYVSEWELIHVNSNKSEKFYIVL
jgi:hypothetical protein